MTRSPTVSSKLCKQGTVKCNVPDKKYFLPFVTKYKLIIAQGDHVILDDVKLFLCLIEEFFNISSDW